MSEKQLEKFNPDVFNTFEKKVQRNLKGLEAFNYTGFDNLTSVYDFNTSNGIPSDIIKEGSVDMVVTSPP